MEHCTFRKALLFSFSVSLLLTICLLIASLLEFTRITHWWRLNSDTDKTSFHAFLKTSKIKGHSRLSWNDIETGAIYLVADTNRSLCAAHDRSFDRRAAPPSSRLSVSARRSRLNTRIGTTPYHYLTYAVVFSSLRREAYPRIRQPTSVRTPLFISLPTCSYWTFRAVLHIPLVINCERIIFLL